ncbi:hypothetical protein JCM19233_333 [Vibrio astriarenae]|nr:hypothetical protein JCM19233_333 [Vibrio sp. C7]
MLIQAIGSNRENTFELDVEKAISDYKNNEKRLTTEWISCFKLPAN